MALELTVDNAAEFQQMVENKDFKISESIVDSILNNINGKKQHVHVLSVTILEEGSTLDITLERKFFIETLEENLKYFIEQEKYEECQKMVEAIDKLKNKKQTKNKNGKSGFKL
jgi:protein-arginine kinase activator protein McsA